MGAVKKIEVTQVEPLPSTSLLGKRADLWMVGGASLLTFFGFQLFTAENADLYRLSMWMYYLSMVVNWPHFMVSYQLLYWDRRRELLKKPAYVWAGLIVPVLILVAIAAGFSRADSVVFSTMVQMMFLTVGWHYVKQVFGTMVVSSAAEKFFFAKSERWALLANLYGLWGLSFLSGHRYAQQSEFFGLKYDLVGVSDLVLHSAYAYVAVTAALTVFLFGKRYLKEGKAPSTTAWVSFFTLYAWYLPFLGHRHFFYVIPFFHSLQYFLFVLTLKKNQWGSEHRLSLPTEKRKGIMRVATGYFGAAFVLGVLFFGLIPTFLDSKMTELSPQSASIWGPTIFMAVFQLFINIHHYFIDNVIWKSDNPDLKEHLFKRSGV